MMSWIPKSRPASTSPHKKGTPLHLKVNLLLFCFVFCSYNFLCFSISFVWTSQWENRVPQISDCFAAKTCYFYFLFGLCFRVDDFHFDCLCYSWFYKFPFHVIEVFDEKRDSHQSQMISRNSPDVHQTKREPVNYPNCFTHSVFFIFYIYCIACSINLYIKTFWTWSRWQGSRNCGASSQDDFIQNDFFGKPMFPINFCNKRYFWYKTLFFASLVHFWPYWFFFISNLI